MPRALKKEEVDWLWNHGPDGEKTEHGHCQKEGEPHLGPEGLLVCQATVCGDSAGEAACIAACLSVVGLPVCLSDACYPVGGGGPDFSPSCGRGK